MGQKISAVVVVVVGSLGDGSGGPLTSREAPARDALGGPGKPGEGKGGGWEAFPSPGRHREDLGGPGHTSKG